MSGAESVRRLSDRRRITSEGHDFKPRCPREALDQGELALAHPDRHAVGRGVRHRKKYSLGSRRKFGCLTGFMVLLLVIPAHRRGERCLERPVSSWP